VCTKTVHPPNHLHSGQRQALECVAFQQLEKIHVQLFKRDAEVLAEEEAVHLQSVGFVWFAILSLYPKKQRQTDGIQRIDGQKISTPLLSLLAIATLQTIRNVFNTQHSLQRAFFWLY
jgi:hypothetical protein